LGGSFSVHLVSCRSIDSKVKPSHSYRKEIVKKKIWISTTSDLMAEKLSQYYGHILVVKPKVLPFWGSNH